MNDVEILCETIRDSFPGSHFIYTLGGCWEFFKILKRVYPEAKPYYDNSRGHVYTLIGESVYDIMGKRLRGLEGLQPCSQRLMSQAHRWKARNFRHLEGQISIGLLGAAHAEVRPKK